MGDDVALAGDRVPGEGEAGAEQQQDAAGARAALGADAGHQQRAGQADAEAREPPAAEALMQEQRGPDGDQHRLQADDDGRDGAVRAVDPVVDQDHLQPQPERGDGQQPAGLGAAQAADRREPRRRQHGRRDQEPEAGERHRPQRAQRDLAGRERPRVDEVGRGQGEQWAARPRRLIAHPCGTLPLVCARLRICSICSSDCSPRGQQLDQRHQPRPLAAHLQDPLLVGGRELDPSHDRVGERQLRGLHLVGGQLQAGGGREGAEHGEGRLALLAGAAVVLDRLGQRRRGTPGRRSARPRAAARRPRRRCSAGRRRSAPAPRSPGRCSPPRGCPARPRTAAGTAPRRRCRSPISSL